MLRKKAFETNKWLKKNKTNTFAKCKLCSNEYKTCNNTSNMLAHLKRSHPETLRNEDSESERSSESENQNDEIICEGTSSSLTPTPIIEPVGTKKVKQAKISRIFDKKTCYTKDSEKKKKLDITLTLMIATDFQPFDVVNDVGFIKFVNLLDPRYKIPCSQTIRNKIMPGLYEKAKLTLQNILEKVEWVALTTDNKEFIKNFFENAVHINNILSSTDQVKIKREATDSTNNLESCASSFAPFEVLNYENSKLLYTDY